MCRQHAIDVLVPSKAVQALVADSARFAAQGTRVLAAGDVATLALLDDKAQFYAAVDCPPAPAPESITVRTLAEFDAAYAALAARHAQLCIKPAVGVYGIGFRRIRTDVSAMDVLLRGMDYQIDLPTLRFMLGQVPSWAPLLVMEYLPGAEYSVDCLADAGVLRCAVARRKGTAAGQGQCIDMRADLQDACARIVAQFGLNGYLNIQFRDGVHGPGLLEVNARMSGGIAMACLAGPNLPWLGLQGFANGYDGLDIGPIADGLRVGEVNQATVLP
jgi:biotin carboxylase